MNLIKRSVTVCSVSCMDNPVCILLFGQCICGGEGLYVSRELRVLEVELGLNKGCVPEKTVKCFRFSFHSEPSNVSAAGSLYFLYYNILSI